MLCIQVPAGLRDLGQDTCPPLDLLPYRYKEDIERDDFKATAFCI